MQWHAQFAWLGDGVAADVLIESDGERIAGITPGSRRRRASGTCPA